VGGKDKQRLEPRNAEYGDNHERNHLVDLAHNPGDEAKWYERHDISDDAEADGNEDIACASYGGLRQAHTAAAIFVDILAHNDGVVNDDTQRNYECEHGYHVDGDIELGKEEEGAEE
jgi:hypothetical protein